MQGGHTKVVQQLEALANETRYRLVCYLGGGQRCVCDLEALTALPQAKVSYHLGILRRAGLVRAEQQGKNVFYSLNQEELFNLNGRMLGEVFATPVCGSYSDCSSCGRHPIKPEA